MVKKEKWFAPHDSAEEQFFEWWLIELQKNGYVESYSAQPESFVLCEKKTFIEEKHLKTKTKEIEKPLSAKHVYTTDFRIIWVERDDNVFYRDLGDRIPKTIPNALWAKREGSELVSYVEVKPTFDQNNMTRLAKINCLWLYDKMGIFTNILKIGNKPKSYFDLTFTPMRFLSQNINNGQRKIHHKTKTLKEYQDSILLSLLATQYPN